MLFKNPIKEGIEEIKKWFDSNVKLIKVTGIRRLVEVAAKLTFSLFLVGLVTVGLLFLGLALSFFFGSLLDSTALGFLIVGGFFLLLMAVMYLLRKVIIVFLLHFFTRIFTK